MSEEKKQNPEMPDTVEFYFEKAQSFRDIFVDGAFGGFTPRGYLQMTIYNERQSIPKKIVHRIKDDGTLGEEKVSERDSKNGIFRSLEANLIMDIEAAESMMFWLATKVEQMRSARESFEHSEQVEEEVN